MTTTSKLVGSEEERAVSPVIGVILMVAITVILAAVIAAFVLDLGQSTGANASAGVSFSEDSDSVTVTFTSDDRTDNGVYVWCEGDVDADNSNADANLESVGSSHTCNPSSGDTVIITADNDGSRSVISSYSHNVN